MIHKSVKIHKSWFIIFCLFSILSSYPKTLQQLKILFVVSSFPPNSGTAVLSQITGLIDRGHDVYIYARRKGNINLAHPDMIRYDLLDRTYFRDKKHNDIPVDLDMFDIIYCQFGHKGNIFSEIKKKVGLKAKLVTCFRGEDISKYLKKYPNAYDDLFKVGDLFLPVCDYFKRKMIRLGCDNNKIIVHHSAIDCIKFSYRPCYLKADETIRMVSVCRLVEKKGLEYSIKAVAKLIKKYPNIEYTIVGFGPLMDELTLLVQKLDVQDNIKLIGRASEDEVAKILDDSHIFILASVTARDGNQEGIPNSAKEAMARGLPVVSTYHAGIPELVENGISGFLVPERDTRALSKQIAYLIKHHEDWPAMGLAGRKKVEQRSLLQNLSTRTFLYF